MVAHFGLDVVHAYMGHVQDNAEESVRRVIDVLKDGAFSCAMDNGARDHASRSASTARRAAPTIDFTGTCAQLPNNFNAPRRSAWPRCSTCSARWSTTTSR